jgi:cysteinyl-tRNA synthetase
VFPHHENEIAQSRCAHGTPVMANVWMHNGFLQVEGEKMSKSLGNFVTINELVATTNFGGHRWQGEVLRLAMLSTHYTQPIDWTVRRSLEAVSALGKFANRVRDHSPSNGEMYPPFVNALKDDLNTPGAISELHELVDKIRSGPADGKQADNIDMLANSLSLLGITKFFTTYEQEEVEKIFRDAPRDGVRQDVERAYREVSARSIGLDPAVIDDLTDARLAARKAKDWKESDRIRDELAALGIQLKDVKDPATGEIRTEWEVKR